MDEMSGHTNGPWRASDTAVTMEDAYGGTITIAETIEYYASPDERYSNARLMAAAPEMMEACVEALAALDANTSPAETHKKLRAAIAKATGEA